MLWSVDTDKLCVFGIKGKLLPVDGERFTILAASMGREALDPCYYLDHGYAFR